MDHLLQAILKSEDDEEKSVASVSAVLFFVLALQTGLTGISACAKLAQIGLEGISNSNKLAQIGHTGIATSAKLAQTGLI